MGSCEFVPQICCHICLVGLCMFVWGMKSFSLLIKYEYIIPSALNFRNIQVLQMMLKNYSKYTAEQCYVFFLKTQKLF